MFVTSPGSKLESQIRSTSPGGQSVLHILILLVLEERGLNRSAVYQPPHLICVVSWKLCSAHTSCARCYEFGLPLLVHMSAATALSAQDQEYSRESKKYKCGRLKQHGSDEGHAVPTILHQDAGSICKWILGSFCPCCTVPNL